MLRIGSSGGGGRGARRQAETLENGAGGLGRMDRGEDPYQWIETTAGDSLTFDVNAATDRISGVTVATFTDSAKDAVDMNVNFGPFPDGTVYAEKIQLTVASQKIGVVVENSGYKKLGP